MDGLQETLDRYVDEGAEAASDGFELSIGGIFFATATSAERGIWGIQRTQVSAGDRDQCGSWETSTTLKEEGRPVDCLGWGEGTLTAARSEEHTWFWTSY